MAFYSNEQVMQSFKLYSTLAMKGYGEKEELRLYMADDIIRGLVEQFAREVDCTIFPSGEYIYMIPLSKNSIYHVSNEVIRKIGCPVIDVSNKAIEETGDVILSYINKEH